MLRSARFFHVMELAGAVPDPARPFEHPCGPDVYRGTIAFHGPDEFATTWRVTGPRKMGTIESRYTREPPAT